MSVRKPKLTLGLVIILAIAGAIALLAGCGDPQPTPPPVPHTYDLAATTAENTCRTFREHPELWQDPDLADDATYTFNKYHLSDCGEPR